jgi:hypothetical protein
MPGRLVARDYFNLTHPADGPAPLRKLVGLLPAPGPLPPPSPLSTPPSAAATVSAIML